MTRCLPSFGTWIRIRIPVRSFRQRDGIGAAGAFKPGAVGSKSLTWERFGLPSARGEPVVPIWKPMLPFERKEYVKFPFGVADKVLSAVARSTATAVSARRR